MRHIKPYKIFESSQELTKEQVEFLNKYTEGSWRNSPTTGLVDVDGDFNCSYKSLEDFKGIRFGKIGGNFYCHENNLTSLEGAPESVGENFWCYRNQLMSLEGGPQSVGRDFFCFYNTLTSLEGAPKTVGRNFLCEENLLISLEGAPRTIGGDFDSGDLKIPSGKWGIETFVDLLKSGTTKEKKLVAPLVDPKVLQQQIDENPEMMLVKLKDVLKHPHFQDLKWPDRLKGEKDLLSDLSDVGL